MEVPTARRRLEQRTRAAQGTLCHCPERPPPVCPPPPNKTTLHLYLVATWYSACIFCRSLIFGGKNSVRPVEAQEGIVSVVDIEEEENGLTALYVAVLREDIQATRLLLFAGANPDNGGVAGAPPLFCAAAKGSQEIVLDACSPSLLHP